MSKYNQIYGKFSVGAGSWMDEKLFEKNLRNPFSKEVISSFKKTILKDLKRINIHNKIKKMEVMDVGSGRQSLALLALGAKKVDHYDISFNNIKKIKKYTKNISNFKSYQKDICLNNFNNDRLYDFIYLQGIIQHTKIPEEALINIGKACKNKGIVWLYHYQPTCLKYFYIDTLRKVFKKKDFQKLEKKLLKAQYSKKLINFFFDDVGCDYIHFKNPNNYKKIMEKMGFTQFYKKDLVELDKGIKFNNIGACLTAYRNVKKNPHKKIIYKKEFIDIWNKKYYRENLQNKIDILQKINKKIILFFKIKRINVQQKIDLIKPIIDGYMEYKKSTTLKEVMKIYYLTNNLITKKE